MKRIVASAVLLYSVTGCYTYRMSVRSGASTSGHVRYDTSASLLWGMTSAKVNGRECTSGFSQVDMYWPWWGFYVTIMTLGLVTPLRAEYVCVEDTSPMRGRE